MKDDEVAQRCQVCFQRYPRHWSVPHVWHRKPDNCTCGHERDAHGWALPCGCRDCFCVRFAGRDDFSCDRWLKEPR
jgi:hypothetical protein